MRTGSEPPTRLPSGPFEKLSLPTLSSLTRDNSYTRFVAVARSWRCQVDGSPRRQSVDRARKDKVKTSGCVCQ
eukprot:3812574-Pyramimonas_sp.AAC.1